MLQFGVSRSSWHEKPFFGAVSTHRESGAKAEYPLPEAEAVQVFDALWTSPGPCPTERRRLRKTPEYAGGVAYLTWPGKASGSPRKSRVQEDEMMATSHCLLLLPSTIE
ncbi:unnamed protein product [Pleuronectes platessa]|uniref:Uncharacterized protein n=1 Tax=Pleuronectes platessa TaxID=8262 RepID=A0A9N7UXN0_PLEPL|nr:unnamed protein product [Pleuronectes platessa]